MPLHSACPFVARDDGWIAAGAGGEGVQQLLQVRGIAAQGVWRGVVLHREGAEELVDRCVKLHDVRQDATALFDGRASYGTNRVPTGQQSVREQGSLECGGVPPLWGGPRG